ncbi:MAG: hypothetical protein U0269_33685 [Polyangiales bacterium]
MRLLRWLFALAFALTLSGCLWRPPPIPPDRAAHDSGSGLSQDSGAESPSPDGSNGGFVDAADSRDARPASDAASESDSSDAASDSTNDAGSNGDS